MTKLTNLVQGGKRYFQRIKEHYQRIHGAVEKTIKPERVRLYRLISQLYTEEGRIEAAHMALTKGLINGTEPDFREWIEHKPRNDLSRGVMASLYVESYHPYIITDRSKFGSQWTEEDFTKLWNDAYRAWESVGNFRLAWVVANKIGDEERAKVYDSLASLLK